MTDDLQIVLDSRIDVVRRRIYLVGEICDEHLLLVEAGLSHLEALDSEAPITIWICSEGGDINAGYGIIDSIKSRSIEINTHCKGNAFSMAAWILAAGDNRSMSPNSYIMIHEGQFGMGEAPMSKTQMDKHVQYHTQLEIRGWKMLGDFTKRSPSWWKKQCQACEFYIDANKAKALGLIDTVS